MDSIWLYKIVGGNINCCLPPIVPRECMAILIGERDGPESTNNIGMKISSRNYPEYGGKVGFGFRSSSSPITYVFLLTIFYLDFSIIRNHKVRSLWTFFF